MSTCAALPIDRIDPAKFKDPDRTATGEPRAWVPFERMGTLWFNTGTLCNLTCRNCYIESSPTNDRLVYLTAADAAAYLDELEALDDGHDGPREIGFTGGEPFMNPDIMTMLADALDRGHSVLVLTNAMRPMRRHEAALLDLRQRHGMRLALRASVDHYTQPLFELERGNGSWSKTIDGVQWLSSNGFRLHVAGRTCWGESEAQARDGYARLFRDKGIRINAADPVALVLFPEMDESRDVPEITEQCWTKLDISPATMMCATSRMIVRRKGADNAVVVPCTLLPYEEDFDMGRTLTEATGRVRLNHPHCARFCVLGGGSCSKTAG